MSAVIGGRDAGLNLSPAGTAGDVSAATRLTGWDAAATFFHKLLFLSYHAMRRHGSAVSTVKYYSQSMHDYMYVFH